MVSHGRLSAVTSAVFTFDRTKIQINMTTETYFKKTKTLIAQDELNEVFEQLRIFWQTAQK